MIKAIVYTSNTGYTKEYAGLLGNRLSLPVYSVKEAPKQLKKKEEILYLGWLFAANVKGYQKAAKRYTVRAVCGVGLGDTGAQINEVRKATDLPEGLPLFTIQGGMDHDKLKGINRFMIKMLTKMLDSKADRTEDESRMLELIKKGGNYVSEQNLNDVLAWYDAYTKNKEN